MKDEDKTEEQLIKELVELRQRAAELEAADTERKQAEEALRESEERFRRMFELSPNSTIYGDLQGNIIACNQQFVELHATKGGQEAQVGRNVSEFFPEEEWPLLFSTIERMIEERHIQGPVEFTTLREDGTRFQVEAWTTLICDADGEPRAMLAHAYDITERKRAEEERRESEKRYVLATDAGQVGVWDWNLETDEIYLDPSLKAMLGYADHEIRNHLDDWGKHVHPDDVEQVMAAAGAHLEGLTPQYEVAHRMVHKDGSVRWFLARGAALRDADGKPYRVVGTDTDITERKQAEEALRENEEKLRAILDASPDVIHLLDINGIILSSNGSFAKRVGLEIDDVVGKSVWDYAPNESAHHRKAAVDKVFRTGEPVQLEDKGLTGVFESYLQPVFNPAREVTAVAVYARDITERKEMEEILRESEAKYSAVVENSKDAIIVLQKGVIKFINRAIVELSGYDFEELIDREFQGLIPPEYRKLAMDRYQARLAGKEIPFMYEMAIIKKDGISVPIEVSNTIMTYEGEEATLCFIRDITERKQAEEALRESEETFSTLFRSNPVGIVITTLKDGRCINVNESFERITGYSREEALGRTSTELGFWIEPSDRKRVTQRLKSDGRVRNLESKFRSREGDIRIGSISAAVINIKGEPCIITALEDITERKRAEEALKQSEERYRDLFNLIPDAVYVIDQETGRVLDVNETACKMYGYTREEWLKMKNTDVSAEPAETRKATKETPEAIPIRYHKKKDGTVFPLEMTLNTFDLKGRKTIVATARDITERQRAEEAIRKSEALLTETGQMAKVGGWEVDAKTLEVSWTEEIYRIHEVPLGYKPPLEEAINFFHPDDRPKLETAIQKALEHGEPFDMEIRLITAKGRHLWTHAICKPIIVDGKTVKLTGTFQDITERQRAEAELLLKDLVFEASITANSISDNHGILTHVNSAFIKIWGYENAEEVVGKPISDFLKFENEAMRVITALNESGEWAGEYTALRKDGSTFNAYGLGTIIKDKSGDIIGYQSAVLDISDQKQADEELRAYRDRLEDLVAARTAELDRRVAEVEQLNQGMTNLLDDLQAATRAATRTAQRLEVTNDELEAFVHSVSHDLRAPLRHADRFAQLLLQREAARLEPTSARYLQNIVQAAGKMGRLIDDLLAFSRTSQTEMKLRRVAPNEIVEQVRQELEPEIEGRLITWEIAPLPTVRADPGLLRIVWTNLLSNAVKYTAPRPQARIEIGAAPPDDEGQVTFFIRDDGVGFNPQYAHKLFGVFQRLHRDEEFEGTGIGLATVRRIIHRHGGRVWAEGEVDRGATFYFTLRN